MPLPASVTSHHSLPNHFCFPGPLSTPLRHQAHPFFRKFASVQNACPGSTRSSVMNAGICKNDFLSFRSWLNESSERDHFCPLQSKMASIMHHLILILCKSFIIIWYFSCTFVYLILWMCIYTYICMHLCLYILYYLYMWMYSISTQ